MLRSLRLLLGLLAAGCATTGARQAVIQQAAFDHDCPIERIQVLEENRSIYAFRVDVCGRVRKYRHLGSSDLNADWRFVDVTDSPTPKAVTERAE